MLYSFDIFDTLISRTTCTPKELFLLVDRELKTNNKDLSEKIGEEFEVVRFYAEKMARSIFCGDSVEEVTIEQIYYAFGLLCALTDDELDYLKRLELETEYSNSIPIMENIDKLKKVVYDGERVVLISDSYFSEEFIRKMLTKHDLIFKDMSIYVSSEYKRTKATGELYRIIHKNEFIKYCDWTHVGDNMFSDGEVPVKLGINTCRFSYYEKLDCEEAILKKNNKDVLLNLLVKASRETRRNDASTPFALGSIYGTAILLSYLIWILHVAEQEGIHDLYFVARDGWILHQIAILLKNNKHTDCELKYIYGSRQAWRSKSGEYAIEEVDNNRDIYKKTDQEVQLIKEYLKQEINMSAKKIGFVEVYGSGTTQNEMATILGSMTDAEVYSFFYCLREDRNSNNQRFYRYIGYDGDRNGIIEALTRSLHGKTIGYIKEEQIKPILVSDEDRLLKEYGYQDYIEGVINTVKAFLSFVKKNNIGQLNGLNFGRDFFEYLTNQESGVLFDYICDMPRVDMVNGMEKVITYAPKPSEKEIANVCNTGELLLETGSMSLSSRRLTASHRKLIQDILVKYLEKREYYVNNNNLKRRIILYGKGKVGQSLYKYIKNNNLAEIVAWTDSSIKESDNVYTRREDIFNLLFDQIVIAVGNERVAEDITIDLMIDGINREDIYWEKYEYTQIN